MGAGVVICLEQGADLHMVQLIPLPLTVSCSGKIQIGFTFLVPAHPGSPGQRAVKWARARVCACVRACVRARARVCVRACVCVRVCRSRAVQTDGVVNHGHFDSQLHYPRSQYHLGPSHQYPGTGSGLAAGFVEPASVAATVVSADTLEGTFTPYATD